MSLTILAKLAKGELRSARVHTRVLGRGDEPQDAADALESLSVDPCWQRRSEQLGV